MSSLRREGDEVLDSLHQSSGDQDRVGCCTLLTGQLLGSSCTVICSQVESSFHVASTLMDGLLYSLTQVAHDMGLLIPAQELPYLYTDELNQAALIKLPSADFRQHMKSRPFEVGHVSAGLGTSAESILHSCSRGMAASASCTLHQPPTPL